MLMAERSGQQDVALKMKLCKKLFLTVAFTLSIKPCGLGALTSSQQPRMNAAKEMPHSMQCGPHDTLLLLHGCRMHFKLWLLVQELVEVPKAADFFDSSLSWVNPSLSV